MRLGETIYNLRARRGMSQGDLADALEVSRQSVSKWETGGATPDLDKLVKMSQLFGVSLDELVTGESTPAQNQSGPEPQPRVIYVEREREDYPKRKIAALALFGFAILVILLCTILGSLLAGVMFSFPFWVCGVICMVFKKRCGLWCAWAVFFLVDVFLRFASGVTWGGIYSMMLQITRGLTIRWMVSLALNACMIALVVWTVCSFRDKVLEPTKTVWGRLIGLAVLVAILQALPWIVSTMAEGYMDSGRTLYAFSRFSQVIGLASQWGKVWAVCKAFIDLSAIGRWKKQQL